MLQKNDSEAQNGNAKSLVPSAERNNSIVGDVGLNGPGVATPGGPPTRNRHSSKMTKYMECWGADKPFANIAESMIAKNIENTVKNTSYKSFLSNSLVIYFLFLLQSVAMIESDLLPDRITCLECQ